MPMPVETKLADCSGSKIPPGPSTNRLISRSYERNARTVGFFVARPPSRSNFFQRVDELGDRAALARDESTLSDADIEVALRTQIERVNGRLERSEPIRKIAVMQTDFPPEVRSVNAFQKIKVDREAVARHYRQEIEEIYSSVPQGEPD